MGDAAMGAVARGGRRTHLGRSRRAVPRGRRAARPRRGGEAASRRRLGWPRDYAMVRAIDRLRAPPLTVADHEGFVTPARLAAENASLAAQPLRRAHRRLPAPSRREARDDRATSRPTVASCSTCSCRGCVARPPRWPRPRPPASTASRSGASSRCASGSQTPIVRRRRRHPARRAGGTERRVDSSCSGGARPPAWPQAAPAHEP